MRWSRTAKIAFIGSHGIRKTTAAHAFSSTVQAAGRSVEYGREVVRDNPLGINERATGEAQLWVLVSQIRQELELAPKAEVLVLDRGVMDNYAYYLRACGGSDLFDVEPLVHAREKIHGVTVFDHHTFRLARAAGGVEHVGCGLQGRFGVRGDAAAVEDGIGEVDEATLRQSFELNFFAHQRVAQAAVKIMLKQGTGGCLLFNVSKQAVNPGKDFGPYGLPKAATLFLVKQYALDHGKDGIRSNAVNADRIDFSMTFDDDTQWQQPWTVSYSIRRSDGELYEYACHEGNQSLTNVLKGARALGDLSGGAPAPR